MSAHFKSVLMALLLAGLVAVPTGAAANSAPEFKGNWPPSFTGGLPVTLTLSWTAVDPDAGDTLTYTVSMGDDYYSLVQIPACVGISTPSCAVGPLAANHTYAWRVVATDDHYASTEGPLLWFITADSAPDAPTNLAAVPSTSGSHIVLSWTESDPTASYIHIQRSPNGSDPWENVNWIAAGFTQYTDETASCDTPYYYRVWASNDIGPSGYSNVASVTSNLCPPTGFTTNPHGPGQIELTWTPDPTYTIHIERLPNGSANWTEVGSAPGSDASFIDGGLTCATHYDYRARAEAAGVYSSYNGLYGTATAACPTTAPAAPTNFSALAVSGSQINLSWTDNANNESGFIIERSGDGLAGWGEIATPTANTMSYQDTAGLTCGMHAYYRIKAVNIYGDSSYATADVATAACPPNNPPTTPGAMTPPDGSGSASLPVTLTWSGGDPDTGDTVTYHVYMGLSTSSLGEITCADPSLTSCDPGPLANSQTYYWKVVATDNHSATTEGGPWSFTTAAVAPTAPVAPGNLSAVAVSGSQVNLSWADNSTDEDSFAIERSANGSTGWTTVGTPAADATTYQDTGLACGSRFYYRVRAHNGAGYSAFSATADAVTAACGPMPRALRAPGLLKPKGGYLTRETTLPFTWKPITGATSYRIQIATDKKFTNLVVNELVPGPTYTAAGLGQGMYYWHVATLNSERQGKWSGTRRLTIDTTPPNAPGIKSPLTGVTIKDTTPRLSVVRPYSAVRYQYQIATDSAFSNVLLDVTTRSTGYTVPKSRALAPGTYFLRVSAFDKAGNQSGWSVVVTFTIG